MIFNLLLTVVFSVLSVAKVLADKCRPEDYVLDVLVLEDCYGFKSRSIMTSTAKISGEFPGSRFGLAHFHQTTELYEDEFCYKKDLDLTTNRSRIIERHAKLIFADVSNLRPIYPRIFRAIDDETVWKNDAADAKRSKVAKVVLLRTNIGHSDTLEGTEVEYGCVNKSLTIAKLDNYLKEHNTLLLGLVTNEFEPTWSVGHRTNIKIVDDSDFADIIQPLREFVCPSAGSRPKVEQLQLSKEMLQEKLEQCQEKLLQFQEKQEQFQHIKEHFQSRKEEFLRKEGPFLAGQEQLRHNKEQRQQ